MSKLILKSLSTDEDVRSIIDITPRLMENGQFGIEGFQTQQFIFDVFNFYKYFNKDRLYLPFNTLVRFQGASKKTAGFRRKFCLDSEILSIDQPYSIEEHKSTCYKLNYQFKPGRPVNSFCEGLFIVYTEEQLIRLYAKLIYRNYIVKQSYPVKALQRPPQCPRGASIREL
jgi:hypothetical protein